MYIARQISTADKARESRGASGSADQRACITIERLMEIYTVNGHGP